jgi:hypothetical protein
MLKLKLPLLMSFLLALTACGGGGGGGSTSGGSATPTEPVISTLTFPMRAIDDADRIKNQFVTGKISGSSTGTPKITFTGTYTVNYIYSPSNVFSYVPIGTRTITNINASAGLTTTAIVLRNFSNGASPESSNSSGAYYFDDNGRDLGGINGSTTFITTSGGLSPISIRVGDRGQLYAQDISYLSFGTARKCGTEVSTYIVEPETATTVIVKTTTTTSITEAEDVCGSSTTAVGYTRYTQTGLQLLYADISDADITFRITVD